MPTSYIIDAARTPRGRGKMDKGALSGVHPQELLAQVLTALQQWEFRPARQNGRFARVEVLLIIPDVQ